MWCQTNLLRWLWAFAVFHSFTQLISQGARGHFTGDRSRRQATGEGEPEMGLLQTEEAILGLPPTFRNSCYNFMYPDLERREFLSPGYPNAYPNNSDCYLLLTAPKGHLVTLDFRDWFAIEDSADCKNDFLEVRDGPHGFNKLKEKKFCGTDFPPMLTSSDRYLWVHFRSDENIEAMGFKAVYDFIPRPPSLSTPEVLPCYTVKEGEEQGKLGSPDIPKQLLNINRKNGMPIDCVWVIKVKENWKIHLQFEKFSLDKPNECESNIIEVFGERTDTSSLIIKFCGSMADSVLSKTNVMILRFYNEISGNKSMFEANYTAFRSNDRTSPYHIPGCAKNEFDCDDDTCISSTLKCNHVFNCRFRWDEDDCPQSQAEGQNNENIAIIMVIFSLILTGMCFTFIFNCIRKLIRDHRTIQEYIRQSREQQLNELEKSEKFEKSKSLSRSRRGSSPSPDHFEMSNSAVAPCYVPGGELLPIMIRKEHSSISSSNNGECGGQRIYTVDGEIMPEMCDSACQTRESLFTTQGYSSGNSTPNHSVTAKTGSPPAPFSTFGYKKETKFKAEARIELSKPETEEPYPQERKRPYSVQTTKSAPDVIVTH